MNFISLRMLALWPRWPLLMAGLAILAPSTGFSAAPAGTARSERSTEIRSDVSKPVYDFRLQVAGNVSMGISNFGFFPGLTGSPPHYGRIGPEPPVCSPNFEFPAGSCNGYLYDAGIWVGGIVGGDTLVSLTVDALSANRDEFAGFDSIRESSNLKDTPFYDPQARSQQQLNCRFYDTLILSSRDESANRPHKPLGLEITQVSHSWLSVPYDNFIIVEYTIRNISTAVIESAYAGFFVDSDVWNRNVGRSDASDDLSGYLRNQGIAYTIDNDGDLAADSTWDSGSIRGALGLAPLRIEPAPSCTSFNWWTLEAFGYDPAHDSTVAEPPSPPSGDNNRYARMANGRIYFDQMWAAVQSMCDPWRRPSSVLPRIAHGADTRFLLSYGSFHLPPGDSITVAMAFVAGDSVHQNPLDFRTYFDPSNPQPYYDRLYFGDLIRNTETARRLYSTGYNPVGGAPVSISAEPLSDTSVFLRWSPAPFAPVTRYRVYRRLQLSQAPWELLQETVPDWRIAADLNAQRMESYEYAVAAVGASGLEGSMSRPARLTAGYPLEIPTVGAEGTGGVVRVTWSAPVQPPGFSPLEYLNIYRRGLWDTLVLRARIPLPASGDKTSSRLGKVEAASASPPHQLLPQPQQDVIQGEFVDSMVVSGRKYIYSASITNTLGLEGARCKPDTALPMALDQGTLVVFSIFGHLTEPSFLNSDSMQSFYMKWAARSGIAPEFFNSGPARSRLPALADLSHFRNVILVSEEAGSMGGISRLADGLKDYISNGGHCILIGRYLPSKLSGRLWPRTDTVATLQTFGDANFASVVLGVRRERMEVTWPSGNLCFPSVQFRGASSSSSVYPTLHGDSAQALNNLMFDYIDNRNCFILGGGIVPAVGVIDSLVDAEVLYTYQAGFPDTSSFQGRPVGIRHDFGKGRVILLNFPLSLMERPAAWDALDTALAHLDESPAPSEPRFEHTISRQLLEYLYGKGGKSADPSWDLNRDGKVDINDLIMSIRP